MDRDLTSVSGGGAGDWRFPRVWSLKTLIILLIALAILAHTGRRVEIDRMAGLSIDAVLHTAGLKAESPVAAAVDTVARSLFPIQLAEETPISRIEGFDPDRKPLFSRVETRTVRSERIDPVTLETRAQTETVDYLIEPFGYVVRVFGKLLETLEIGLWGTVIAVVIAAPLALAGAAPLTPHPWLRTLARGLSSLLRAVPELISALFLVLAYGFGPIAGILALGLHGAGFLGKFYAEDIENADVKPQEALRAIGASKLKIFQFAILPQVTPQYVAYTLYILDRNVRMATVIGLVGAGGIGQELKGRYDMYDYGHVATILIAIFLLVLALDHLSVRIRRKYL